MVALTLRNIFMQQNLKPDPYGESVAFVLTIITAVIGFIMFSYFIQSDPCFLYTDWRRQFSLYASLILVLGTILYSLPFIAMITPKPRMAMNEPNITHIGEQFTTRPQSEERHILDAIVIRLIISVSVIAALIVLYGPLINLVSKTKIQFEEGNPKQKKWSAGVSALLIFGSTIPLINYIGAKIIKPKMVITL